MRFDLKRIVFSIILLPAAVFAPAGSMPIAVAGSETPVESAASCEKRIYRLFLEIEDGDTVVYRGRHMRFLGVDAPELRNPDLGFYTDQPYGREAKEYVRRRVREAKRVTYCEDGEDYYGRLLVHIFVDGYPLSLLIVEAGLGYETVSVFGDNGFSHIAAMILEASKLHEELPFENPYQWRRKNRVR
jgi:endonuclease YncB( thermonuclease family)